MSLSLSMLKEIKVKWCIDNDVDNHLFENALASWDPTAGGTSTYQVLSNEGYKESHHCLYLSGPTNNVAGLQAYVSQDIVNKNNYIGKVAIVSFAAKSNCDVITVSYKISGTESFITFNNESIDNWARYYYLIDLTNESAIAEFKVFLYHPDRVNNTGIYPAVCWAKFDDIRVYRIEEKELDMDNTLMKSSTIKTQIEEKLFGFKADNVSLTLKNNSGEASYFDNQDFYDEDYLYALQFKYEIESVTKYVTLFVDKNSIHQFSDYKDEYLTLSTFELSGLMKDKNWYIGNYIYSAEAEAGIVRIDFPNPSPLCDAVNPDDDIMDKITDEFETIIIEEEIPISPDKISNEIETNLVSDETLTNIFDLISETGEGRKVLIDYFVDVYTNRIFLLLGPNDVNYELWQTTTTQDLYFDLYEIVNGTTLNFIDSMQMHWYVDDFWDHIKLALGFVHEWKTNETSETKANILICQKAYIGSSFVGTTARKMYEFKYDNIGNVNYIGDSIDYFNWNHPDLDNIRYTFVDEDGNLAIDTIEYSHNNFHFLSLFNNFSDYYTTAIIDSYLVSEITVQDPLWVGLIDFAYVLTYTVYKYPNYLKFGFSEITLSELMKEICFTQDALWFFKYLDNEIVIYIRRRDQVNANPDELDDESSDNIYGPVDKYKYELSYDDLTIRIYENDPLRTKVFRKIYNDKYSKGKRARTIIIYSLKNFALGDEKVLTSENDKYFLIKGVDYQESISEKGIKRRTKLDLFQVFQMGE